MNREHSSKGYKVVANTTPASHQFYGLTVIAEAVISSIIMNATLTAIEAETLRLIPDKPTLESVLSQQSKP